MLERLSMLKFAIAVTGAALLLTAAYAVVNAEDNRVTPYGDYCKDCAVYGGSREEIAPRDAIIALFKYYQSKGCSVGMIHHKGRFIEAEILRNNRRVDKVLLDRRTGRLRSIY